MLYLITLWPYSPVSSGKGIELDQDEKCELDKSVTLGWQSAAKRGIDINKVLLKRAFTEKLSAVNVR